jgi:hypothetical protein
MIRHMAYSRGERCSLGQASDTLGRDTYHAECQDAREPRCWRR